MKRQNIKRETDLLIINDWIDKGSSVLDLGCGRGILLEHLQRKQCYTVGVDNSIHKIRSCVKRGVSAYHGDAMDMLQQLPDNHFDWVVCSRTLQDLEHPKPIIMEALRVGQRAAMGFINYGYWLNRLSILRHGRRTINEVYPSQWHDAHPINPLTIAEFKTFCDANAVSILRTGYLAGNWLGRCRFLPNLRSGYVLMEISASQRSRL